MRRSTVLSLPLQLVFSAITFNIFCSEATLFSKSSCLAPDLGVTQVTDIMKYDVIHTFVPLKSDIDVRQTYLSGL
jgi:hypothetical protein